MAQKSELVQVGFFANQADAAIGSSVQTGITADTGSAQAGAYQLTKTMSVIGTVAVAGDSVLLPKGANAGDEIWVRNNGANSADVFPQSGGAINGGSDNAAFAVGASKTAIFKCLGNDDWLAVLTA